MRLVVLSALCLAGCDGLFGLNHIRDPGDDDDAAVDDAHQLDGRPIDATDDRMPDAYQQKNCVQLGYGLIIGGSTTHYRTGATQKSWIAAEIDCQDDVSAANNVHTHLVVLESDIEASNVYSGVLFSNAPGGFWVGYSDRVTSGNFKWVTDEVTSYPPSMGGPWETGQPDNSGDCLLTTTQIRIDDVNCNEVHYYACECDVNPVDPNNF